MINLRFFIYLCIASLAWVGCSTPKIEPTPILCNQFIVQSSTQVNCIDIAGNTLIQTPLNEQIQLSSEKKQLTIIGTAYLQNIDSQLKIAVLEGTTVIAVPQAVMTLHEGQSAIIDSQYVISKIQNYELSTLVQLPLQNLKREVNLIQPTATPIMTATPVLDCPIPTDWTDSYEVQSGESLTIIAQKANVTVEDLQTANCLENPNNIQVGIILRVPLNSIQPTEPAQTYTPSAVFFRADKFLIVEGECTTLRWDIQNIRQLTLNGEIVTDRTSLAVCPTATTPYSLVVDYFDETQSQHSLIIELDKS